MTSDPIRASFLPFPMEAELDLFHLIHTDQPYPWNPAEPEAMAYFAELEQEVARSGWTDDDLAVQSTILAGHFEQLWNPQPVAPVSMDVVGAITQKLGQQFASLVPPSFIESIVGQAQRTLSGHLSLADQLIMCAQDLLPGWGQEDLLVLARPYAYQTRGAETELLDSTLQSLRGNSWESLSGIEQARLTLAIARCAIEALTDQ